MMGECRFECVLTATGFVDRDGAAEGLLLPGAEGSGGAFSRYSFLFDERRFPLRVAGLYRVRNVPAVMFFDATDAEPTEADLREWHRMSWNFGLTPLLWVSTPTRVLLLNSYAEPKKRMADVLIEEFDVTDEHGLRRVAAACGRFAFETGAFWKSEFARRIDRRGRVDVVLLRELAALEDLLRAEGLDALLAQKLIGRAIFTQYLTDRGLLNGNRLHELFANSSLPALLRDPASARGLFSWLKVTFNGDLFPPDRPDEEDLVLPTHLGHLADFLDGFEASTGQWRLFPFRFDVIPVELISSIYEQFAHSIAGSDAAAQGLHYTPINLVDLALDLAMVERSGTARVLDPACGSGVFLVEAMRRLVWQRSREAPVTRQVVRDVLYNQLFGVDVNPGALQVTAFSLYLAALELDPELRDQDLAWLRFDRLIGRTLHHSSFFDTPQLEGARFDVIVGNPPWTYDAKATGGRLGAPSTDKMAQPRRSPDWAFLWHARELAGPDACICLLMKANPFFSKDRSASEARRTLLASFQDVTLVNMSQLRLEELFPAVPDRNGASKAVKGAALLFSGRAAPAREQERVALANLPWSDSFRRNGVLDVAPDLFKKVAVEQIRNDPVLFKAAMFGNAREFGVMENLRSAPGLVPLGDWCRHNDIPFEQGIQVAGGGTGDSSRLIGLPYMDAGSYRAGRTQRGLPPFGAEHAHRPRDRSIYRGPLVLCPEAGFAKAVERGRYSAAIALDDVVYSDSIVGISLAGRNPDLATLLTALLTSKVTAFQLAFGASNLGLKQPKVEKVDLESLLIPDVLRLSEGELRQFKQLEPQITGRSITRRTLDEIDDLVLDLYRLSSADRRVIKDVLCRSRPMFMDTREAKLDTVARLDEDRLLEFGAELSHWLDTVLAENGYHRTIVSAAVMLDSDTIALRLDLEDGPVRPVAPFRIRGPELFEAGLLTALDRRLSIRRSAGRLMRLYIDKSIYLVKPNERRFWTIADAQADLELILADHEVRRNRLLPTIEAERPRTWKPAHVH